MTVHFAEMLIMWGTAGVGLLIGLVVGSFGGGGGVLTVPVLVYLLGQSAQDATASSVVIVGATAVVGVLARVRARTIAWPTGLAFGAAGIPAAYLGTALNQRTSEHVVLLAFAGVTVVAAAAMLLDDSDRHPEPDPGPGPHPGSDHRDSAVRVGVLPTRSPLATAAKVVGFGVAMGFLTGFLGVGGGFLVVPALVLVLRMPISAAIGTSLLIIALNAAAALASRTGLAGIDWPVVLPFAAAAVLGTLAGKLVSDRLPGITLTRAFGVLLLLVGVFVAVENLVLS
jgi:uncharacterized protein